MIYNDYKLFDVSVLNISNTTATKKKIKYFNFFLSFDIETTSLYKSDNEYITNNEYHKLDRKLQKRFNKIAFMYIWQVAINGDIIFGRTWQEFKDFIYKISDFLMTDNDHRLIVYVHNLGYEFQFLRKHFNFTDVFALTERKPIKAVTDFGLEFRCSYLLSGYSLETLAKNLNSHKIEKLKGDLDYNLVRHNKTIINNDELKYCINDVLIVEYYIEECIERFGSIADIPLTQTGIVRNYVREKCLNTSGYYYFIKYITMEKNEFLTIKRAFQGGFTHANLLQVGKVIENVSSYDFTSSYPYVLLSEKYPMSKGKKINYKISESCLKQVLSDYLAIFDVTYYDIETKYNINIIPFHKCYVKEKCFIDNGKVYKAKKIKISVTNIDFYDIRDFYNYSHCEISNLWLYEKKYLPKTFLECVIKFYSDKTTLKNVIGKETEYLHGKEMLNSLYGMCVTDIIRDDIIYSGDWKRKTVNIDDKIECYNTDKRRFLAYIWGVFCTSYARHNLYTGLLECKNDYIYCDTDSIKLINRDKHIKYFNDYNKNCIDKLNKMCDFYNFSYDVYKPRTIKGNEKIIGVWDFEGIYKRFKTLGAKRYIYETENKIEMVVSGLGKKAIEEIKRKGYNNNDIFNDIFNVGMKLERGETGKLTHTYIDNEIKGKIADYRGIMGSYEEKSYIHLEETEFLMTLQNDFIELLWQVANKNRFENKIYNI